ncbi:MAG: MnmC family methyltransferase [Burkholderiaceae bacterium]
MARRPGCTTCRSRRIRWPPTTCGARSRRWRSGAHDAQRLLSQWPDALPGLHRLLFEDGAVTLTLCFGDALALVPKLRLGADAIFLDGFSPARNPRMWDPALMRALGRLARPGATLATWSAAGAVREALHGAGFDVERVAGSAAGKRHRLRGRATASPLARRCAARATAALAGAHRAGGRRRVAGAAVAAGFARRGWQTTVPNRPRRLCAVARHSRCAPITCTCRRTTTRSHD